MCCAKLKMVHILSLKCREPQIPALFNAQLSTQVVCTYYIKALDLLIKEKTKNDKGGYKKLRPVIFLAVMEETLFPNKTTYLSHHQFRDIVTYEHDLKQMSFSFLELSKFHKEFDELDNDIEKWAYFFKHASHIDPDDLDKVLKEDSALSSAYRALERSGYTPEQLLEYDRYAWKEEEIQTRINDARLAGEKAGEEKGRAEGMEKGMEQGRSEGAKQKAIETAKKMLSKGLDIYDISDFTGLSAEEIKSL